MRMYTRMGRSPKPVTRVYGNGKVIIEQIADKKADAPVADKGDKRSSSKKKEA